METTRLRWLTLREDWSVPTRMLLLSTTDYTKQTWLGCSNKHLLLPENNFDLAMKEGLWLQQMVTALTLDHEHPILSKTDSVNALQIVTNNAYILTTKWLDIRYHFWQRIWSLHKLSLTQTVDNWAPARMKTAFVLSACNLTEVYIPGVDNLFLQLCVLEDNSKIRELRIHIKHLATSSN